MTLGVALGQVAIVVGLVPSYVPTRYVHGLAVLGVLGMASSCGCSARRPSRTSALFGELDGALSPPERHGWTQLQDGILVVDVEGSIRQFNSQFAQMWRLPDQVLEVAMTVLPSSSYWTNWCAPTSSSRRSRSCTRFRRRKVTTRSSSRTVALFERHSRPQQVDGVIVGRVWSSPRRHRPQPAGERACASGVPTTASPVSQKPRLVERPARTRARPVPPVGRHCPRSCSATSTASRWSMTRSATTPATTSLVEVARRLANNLRDGDTAARLGGDEFAIVLDETTTDDTIALAQRLLEVLREPFVVNERDVFVPASIGIADNGTDVLDADELLCRADIAMYAAKSRGRKPNGSVRAHNANRVGRAPRVAR